MSTHEHAATGGDHVPHVQPLSMYFTTWGALLVLTAITVGASYLDVGHSANLFISLTIATIKGTLVALLFMHLRWDHKFHSLILMSSFLFLAIFIIFTIYDTGSRGRAEGVEASRPFNTKTPFVAGAIATTAPPATQAAEAAPAAEPKKP